MPSSLESNFHALQLTVDIPTAVQERPRIVAPLRQDSPSSLVSLTDEALEANRRRNALVPLLQLPSELLLAILHEYIVICRRRSHKQLHDNFYTWIKVTHVCHQLREVALGDPTLWNLISVVNPDLMRELLVRSQQTPLTYDIGHFAPTEAAFAAARVMLGALDRVESLRYMHSNSHSGKFPEFTAADAPKLRSLTLHNAEQLHPRSATMKAPLILVGSKLPCLEKLDAALLPYASIETLFRPTLRHLSLSTCTAPGIGSSLIRALVNMPLLDTLKLNQVLPEAQPSHGRLSSSGLPHVSLPHLRFLQLSRCGALECAEFLNHLSFPSSTALHLDLRPTGRHSWCNVVIPSLTAKFKDRDPIQTVCIHSPWNSDVQVAVWSRAMTMDEFESQEISPDLCITMYGHHGGTIECDETLVSLTCDLPLSSVRTLFIGELNPYLKRNSSWIAMFSPMTQTEILGVSGSSVEFISNVFHRPREHKLTSSGGGQVMPKLKCLSLRKVTFKEDYEAAVTHSYDFIHNLRGCLLVRNERHKKLESLRIRLAVNLADEDAQLLRDVADILDWDGRVTTVSLRRRWGDDQM